MRPRSARLGRGIFARLFAVGVVIAAVAVGVTTWVTVDTTAVSIQDQQRESLHNDATAYNALVGYAAVHADWTGARSLLTTLAERSGHDVTLTTTDGVPILTTQRGSAASIRRDPSGALIAIDPTSVDRALIANAVAQDTTPPRSSPAPCRTSSCRDYHVIASDTIDARAIAGLVRADRNGRAAEAVRSSLDACLRRSGIDPVVTLTADLAAVVDSPDQDGPIRRCLDPALRSELQHRIAPEVLLFTGDQRDPTVSWVPTPASWARIVLSAAVVLLLTIGLCALLAASVAHPLRRLAATLRAAHAGDLHARTNLRRPDEIGDVAAAFDELAERRQQLEEARVRLTSDISHELRTPLANISGWIEAGQDGMAELDTALLDTLQSETDHLIRLVADLHDLALGDAGELVLRRDTVGVRDLLQQVVASFAARSGDVELKIDGQVDPDAVVQADAVRLRQAVVNLVGNALRHTPAGGVVAVSGSAHTITVQDTGEGIPAADLPFVFDRFRRVDPSRSRYTGGSGLGLAIVKQIAEAHGGRVAIASSVGTGTTVTIFLGPGSNTSGRNRAITPRLSSPGRATDDRPSA